ncbi:hypothetical protein GF360_03025 [candidate division WWE3 bacterium]|nr:hypothetical protein [candidate division WWE3 bacterium]
MLTKADITAKLKDNPDWEPGASATDEEWDLYYEVLDSMEFDDGQVVEEEDTDDDDWSDWEDDDEMEVDEEF